MDANSLVPLDGPLLRFFIMPRLWRRCIIKPKGTTIRELIRIVVLVGVKVVHSLEVEVLGKVPFVPVLTTQGFV